MKKPCKYLRFYSLFLLLLLASHVSAEVTSSYNSSTNTLTFSGSGVLTHTIADNAPNISSVSNIVIGSGVTKIEADAFSSRIKIKTLDLTGATSLTTIESGAFWSCSLTSLTVPSTVTSIGRFAFLLNPLKTIEFESSQQTLEIGANAFTNGEGGGKIETFRCFRPFTYAGRWDYEYGLTHTAEGIFQYEKNLTSVTIDGYTSAVPSYSFYECENLTGLTLSSTALTTIERNAFSYCGFTSLTVPKNVTSIEKYAFYKAPLTFIEFASTTTALNLGASVFSANMPSNHGVVKTFRGYRPFTYAGRWDSSAGEADASVGLFQYEDQLTNVTLLNMSSIYRDTFYGCDNLTTLTIGGSLAKVTYTASNNLADVFPNLQKLTINSGATSIGAYAFYDSPNLSSVNIPTSMTSVGEHAFDLCPNVTSLNFDVQSFDQWWSVLQSCANSITDLHIPNDAIANHAWTTDDNLSTKFPNVQKATFGPAVTTLHDLIFYVPDSKLTNKLKTVEFNSNVTLGWSAFCNNASLSSITTSRITECGVTCFKNCRNLKDLDLPACVQIKSQAFYGCTGLTTMRLGSPLTTIGSDAFRGCANLKTLYINSPSYLSNSFADGSSVVNLFGDRLTTIYVQDDVQSIGSKAFAGTSTSPLSDLVIGTGVTSIASDAFAGNTQLTDVTIQGKSLASRTYTASSNLADVFPYLQHLTYGAEVDKVADYSFYVAKDENFPLAKVSFGQHVDIGRSAFCNNKALTTIGMSVKSVYEYSFANTNIKSIDILDDDIIDANAFEGCTSLSSVTLPRTTLTTIKEYAFYNCI